MGQMRCPSNMERLEKTCIPEPNTGCWLWLGGINPDGYGVVSIADESGRMTSTSAQRFSWTTLRGQIPHGMQIDHLCRNTLCVNPDHLEPVTPRENQRRSSSIVSANMAATHCLRGHELAGENIVVRRGRRVCIKCRRFKDRTNKMARRLEARRAHGK